MTARRDDLTDLSAAGEGTDTPGGLLGSQERLRAWCDTWIGGARLHQTAEPVYRNPGELKADIRAILAERKRAESYREALTVIASFLERAETGYARESVRTRIRRLLDGGSWHDALTDEEVGLYG